MLRAPRSFCHAAPGNREPGTKVAPSCYSYPSRQAWAAGGFCSRIRICYVATASGERSLSPPSPRAGGTSRARESRGSGFGDYVCHVAVATFGGEKGRGGLATRRTAGAGQKSPPLPPHNNGRTRLKSPTTSFPTKIKISQRGGHRRKKWGSPTGGTGPRGPHPEGPRAALLGLK